MKLTGEQYSELVDKLADEIVEGAIEKEAGLKFGSKNKEGIGKRVKGIFNGSRVKGAVGDAESISELIGKNTDAYRSASKGVKREKAKRVGAFAGAGAGASAGAGALAVTAINKKKKQKKDSENLEKEATELYEYAMRKIAACEAMYYDGMSDQGACIEVLAEAGLYDEDGFNKEAAESSEEAIEFSNEISGVYDESLNKIAAAEECYQEAVSDLGQAVEVLEAFGYEFE